MSDDIVKRLRATPNWMREEYGHYKDGLKVFDRAPFEAADALETQAARIADLEAALAIARREGLEEAARRVEIIWLMFREKDNGASDWIFRAHDDIPTGDDFATAIRALGEKE